MFKKEQDIEQDFMRYKTDNVDVVATKENKESKKFSLNTVIQLLVIFILIGVLAAIALFGYKYFTNDMRVTKISSEVENKRVYTYYEVQAMLQKLKEQNTQIEQTTANSEEDNTLLTLLENAEVDQMEDISTQVNFNSDKREKVATQKSENEIDSYNKVVVSTDSNSGDELANLSKGLNAVLQDVDTKNVASSNYTKMITKEVSTRESEMRMIVVQPGDSLSKIAKRAYGSVTEYNRLLEANPELMKNPNVITVGQRLRVPSI